METSSQLRLHKAKRARSRAAVLRNIRIEGGIPMRLLVAEDQPDLNDVICKTLEKNHYTVDSCLDGEEALLCLSMTEYDAAILDIMMPKKKRPRRTSCHPLKRDAYPRAFADRKGQRFRPGKRSRCRS